MEKVECYRCDICESIYQDSDEAVSCEKTHSANDDLGIVDTVHRKEFSRYGFPETITLEIKNYSGCLAEYSFVREGPVEDFVSS